MDKPTRVQKTQSVTDLKQHVQNRLRVQYWEFCTLKRKKKTEVPNLHCISLNLDVGEIDWILYRKRQRKQV